MRRALIIDAEKTEQAYVLCLPLEIPCKAIDSSLYVKEDGCYMKDYEIDAMGVIVHTSIQHVVDTFK